MVDFIKVLVKDQEQIEKLWNNDKLLFYNYKERLDYFDKEIIRTKRTRSYKGILIAKYERKMELLIAPHLLKNKYRHNADDFNVRDCIDVLSNLLGELDIQDKEHFQVINLEFGVNFLVPGYSYDLIMFAELWKRTPFRFDLELGYSKKAFAVKDDGRANTYKIVKLYSKGIDSPQYCHRDTIRFEIKSKRSGYISKLGVRTLFDLLNPMSYRSMCKELVETSKDLLFIDHSIYLESMSCEKQNLLKKYLNPHIWFNILKQKHRNTFLINKKKYLKLLDENGQNIHTIFPNVVSKKANQLSSSEGWKCADSPLKDATEKCADFTTSIKEICTFSGQSNLEGDKSIQPNEKSSQDESKKMAISESLHIQNNNWVMAHLHEMGIKTKRNDPIQRKVRRLISWNYKGPAQYHNAIIRIKYHLLESHQIEISERELMRLADKSRKLKGKKLIKIS